MTWTSMMWPWWCLPTLTGCHATETMPLAATRRVTQSAPVRRVDRAPRSRRRSRVGLGGGEALRRGASPDCLVGSVGVVFRHPPVDGGLGVGGVGEDPPGEAFPTQRAVETLDLAGGGG